MGRAFGGPGRSALFRGFQKRHEALGQRVAISRGAEKPEPFADEVSLLQDLEMADDGTERNAQRGLEHGNGAGPVQQFPENENAAGMRQGGSKAVDFFVLREAPPVKRGLHRQQKRPGAGHLGIRLRQIMDVSPLSLDADKPSGLQASKFLAGEGKANLGIRGQPGDGRARLGQDQAEQAQPGGAGQHPARSP